MKLEMHKNSLFAILLRSPWWVSLGVAGALFAGLRLVVPALYAGFFALPFLVIGTVVAWRQLRAPSRAAIEKKLDGARAMDARAFTEKLEAGFRAQGYTVTRVAAGEVDLELEKGGQLTLVSCRRWKAARTGVEPLRQLKAAARERRADCAYVVAGEVTEAAAQFAAGQGMRILSGAELAKLL